jgi:hypothetical protein
MHGGEERGMTACYDMIWIISIELLNYPIFFLLKSIFLFCKWFPPHWCLSDTHPLLCHAIILRNQLIQRHNLAAQLDLLQPISHFCGSDFTHVDGGIGGQGRDWAGVVVSCLCAYQRIGRAGLWMPRHSWKDSFLSMIAMLCYYSGTSLVFGDLSVFTRV